MSWMRAFSFFVAMTFALSLAAAGQGVPFLNQPLVPASVAPGSAGFTLTVNGGNFLPGSVVNWNGSALATTYVTATQLTAVVPAAGVAVNHTANVTVSNPSPSGGISIAALLPVTSNLPALSFKRQFVVAGSSPISVAVADFNGDGKADIAFINAQAGESNPVLVSVQLGNGDGTFTHASTILIQQGMPTGGGQILAGDFNGDGKMDLAFSSAPTEQSTFSVALGNGDGTFQTPFAAEANESGFEFVAGDFNRDGNLDLANLDPIAGGFLLLFLGNGDGSLDGQGTFLSCCGSEITAGDFNQDGILDLAAGANILLGDGNGNFAPPASPVAGSTYPPLTADFNGDGIPDLVFPGTPATVFLGRGDGTFTQKTQWAPFNSVFLVAGDFNGDGKLDLVSIDGTSAQVSLLLGKGDGTFRLPIPYGVQGTPNSLAVADFNNDGHLDLALTGSNHAVSILLSVAKGIKTRAVTMPSPQ